MCFPVVVAAAAAVVVVALSAVNGKDATRDFAPVFIDFYSRVFIFMHIHGHLCAFRFGFHGGYF